MTATVKRTISLSNEQAAFVAGKVDSGRFASASEVVRAGLRALEERDQAVERWLYDEVAPVYDAMQAQPSRAVSINDAFDAVREHHRNRYSSQ